MRSLVGYGSMATMKRVVIVASSQSYRTGDFLSAARLLGVEPIVVSDGEPTLPGAQVRIDLADPDGAVEAIRALEPTPDAVIAIDDQGVSLAARASRKLGLATNPAQAVAATRNKLLMRRLFEDRNVAQPRFAQVDVGEGADLATDLGFPVVLKPAGLSASRGVIRADDAASARRAERRIRTILADSGLDAGQPLLVEEYLSGAEVAVEGIVVDGSLEVLAIIDKPDSMDGPFFEETMLVTPSRLPPAAQEDAIALTTAGIGALGLVSGPVHAEIRADDDGSVRLLELAARSIGGLCGRAFTFGLVGEAP